MAFLNSIYFFWIELICWSLAALIILVILLIEIRTMIFHKITHQIEKMAECSDNNSNKSDQSPTDSNKTVVFHDCHNPIFVFPILSYTFYFASCVAGIVCLSPTEFICYSGNIIGSCLYAMAKMFMYLVFIYRLKIVYDDSLFEYNSKVIYIMVIIVIVYQVVLMIANAFTISTTIVYIENSDFGVCATHYVFGIIESVVILDLITNALCCYLFIKPLIILSKDNKDNTPHSKGMFLMVQKSTVLTFVAVMSTFILLLTVSISGLSALVAIDIIINCVCIMLFNKNYVSYFKSICCGFVFVCDKLFHSANI
eukprot:368070_1